MNYKIIDKDTNNVLALAKDFLEAAAQAMRLAKDGRVPDIIRIN